MPCTARAGPTRGTGTLSQHLAQTSPEDVPDRIVRVLRESSRLPWVALDVEQDGTYTRAAEQGVKDASLPVERFDLSYAGGVPGHLLVQSRRGERTLGRLDRRLIRQVADQTGRPWPPRGTSANSPSRVSGSSWAARRNAPGSGATCMTALVQHWPVSPWRSPPLDGSAFGPRHGRHTASNPETEAGTSWADVRRILDDLRPPGLEELGLVGALEERDRALSRPGEFTVTIAADGLPPLPTAVETAAYRIALEAMSNSARHAHARRCAVAVTADGLLHVTVEDDGAGLPTQPIPGVGIQSMHARAADLGGLVRLGLADGGGTRVVADLPIQAVP